MILSKICRKLVNINAHSFLDVLSVIIFLNANNLGCECSSFVFSGPS